MKRVGRILPTKPERQSSHSEVTPIEKARAAQFARLKTDWAMQVAADKELPETALRIALAWPFWLNSKTLLAWPAQSTIAETVNCGVRAIRGALKRLEERGHLFCTNTFRGGRRTNSYRIVLQDVIVHQDESSGPENEGGTSLPATPGQARRSGRNDCAGHHGSDNPISAEAACRGTLERTLDRTEEGEAVSKPTDAPQEQRGLRATKEAVADIMRQAYGEQHVTEFGYLKR